MVRNSHLNTPSDLKVEALQVQRRKGYRLNVLRTFTGLEPCWTVRLSVSGLTPLTPGIAFPLPQPSPAYLLLSGHLGLQTLVTTATWNG